MGPFAGEVGGAPGGEAVLGCHATRGFPDHLPSTPFSSQQPMRFSNRCLQMIGRCWPHLRALGVGGAGCGVQGLASLGESFLGSRVVWGETGMGVVLLSQRAQGCSLTGGRCSIQGRSWAQGDPGSLSAESPLYLLLSEKLHAAAGPRAGPCVGDHPGGGR